MVTLDLSRLRKGEQIFGASALLLLISSVIPMWAKIEVDLGGLEDFGGVGGTQRFSAWSGAYGFMMKMALILALVGVILVVIRALGTIEIPLPAGPAYLGIGGLAALLMVIQAAIGTTGGSGATFGGLGIEISRGPLLFLGVLLSLGMAAGGYLMFKEEPAGTGSALPPGGPGGPAGPGGGQTPYGQPYGTSPSYSPPPAGQPGSAPPPAQPYGGGGAPPPAQPYGGGGAPPPAQPYGGGGAPPPAQPGYPQQNPYPGQGAPPPGTPG